MGIMDKLFPPRPPESAKTLDPNSPCWCGSAKRYADCHHDSDRKYFEKARHGGGCGST